MFQSNISPLSLEYRCSASHFLDLMPELLTQLDANGQNLNSCTKHGSTFRRELHLMEPRPPRVSPAYLVAVDAQMMSGDEGLEDDHPAGIGGSLEQRVGHLRDVYVGGIGG